MSGVDADAAARLIEALMTDAALRERFRRDPVKACRAAGLDELADEMASGEGKAMQTLDLRESRSSLAGVLMAAAVEGFAAWQVVEHAADVSDLVSDVLSRVDLPAIPDLRGGGEGGSAAAAGAGGPAAPGAAPGGLAAVTGAGAPADGAPAGQAAPAEAGAPAAAAAAPSAAATAAATASPAAPGAPAATTPDAPSGTTPDAPAGTTPDAPAGTAPEAGGASAGATRALLEHPRLTADEALKSALSEGTVGAHAAASLTAAVTDHDIAAHLVEGTTSIEITAVDGQPVEEANVAARDLAETLGALPKGERPLLIGTPWAIDGTGFTTGPQVGDRLRLDFDASAGGGAKDPAAPPAAPGASRAPDTVAATPDTPPAAAAPPPAAPAAVAPAPEPVAERSSAARIADPLDGAERAAAPGRNDTLSLAVPKAEPAAAAPDRNASLTLPAQADPRAQRAAAPAAATDPVGALPHGAYPGDDAPKAQLAAWLGAEARERGLPAELPVMAALVESGVKNLNYGDRDSVGFFQMRTSIWNQGAYEGYPNKPELQIKWFLDHAAQVRDQRVARGQSVTDPEQYGEWIADVERPAEQYRGRYQLQLDEARALLRTGAETPAPVAPAAAVTSSGGDSAAVADAPSAADAAGGGATAEAVLANPRLHFDDVGKADLKAGRIDPRVLAALTKLSEEHELTISCMRSDHSKFTAGGSVSNHFHGRGVDIATVDGQTVNAGSSAARELAQSLSQLSASYRPDEVGTPWPLAAPGYFTDAGHQDHIHVGFKTELPSGWTPPAGLGGEPVAARAAASSGIAAPAGAAADPAAGAGDTLGLPAIAERHAAGRAGRSDSLSLPAVDPTAGRAAPDGAPAASAEAAAAAAAAPAGGAAPVQAAADAANPAPAAATEGAAGAKALAAVAEARRYLGTPYLWGGSSPKTGFDCSGLVQWAYAQQGIRIPRVTYDQIDAPNGRAVSRDDLAPGDLVFFATAAGDVHHVGMSLGGDRFIHAPHTGDVVKISSLNEPYYAGQFTGGRRFDQSAAVASATAPAGTAAAGTTPAGTPAAAGEPVAARAALVAAGDEEAVAAAESARVRDAHAARDPNSMIFRALSEQEASSHRDTLQFLAAVRPDEAQRVASAATRAGIIEAAPLPSSAVGYPGDDAPQRELARWLASHAQKAGLPPELPVMAALVESGVKNLNYGDRDSVGFFQMRTTIWNKDAYAGYPDQPELQIKWFLDHAQAVKRSRLAAGNEDFGRDPSSWGEWIADVERPAEQYRGRYQLRLAEARRLLGR